MPTITIEPEDVLDAMSRMSNDQAVRFAGMTARALAALAGAPTGAVGAAVVAGMNFNKPGPYATQSEYSQAIALAPLGQYFPNASLNHPPTLQANPAPTQTVEVLPPDDHAMQLRDSIMNTLRASRVTIETGGDE